LEKGYKEFKHLARICRYDDFKMTSGSTLNDNLVE
jgi:hypothetical protein